MQSWSKITHYAGFDWAHDHHEVVIVNRSGKIVADFQIEHTAQGWQRWREQVAALGPGSPPTVSAPVSGGNSSRQLPVWIDPHGLSPATLQQAAPPRCASVGQHESAILSVGRCLLRAAPHTRQEPRLRPTLPRSTLAKNPLENVADRHAL
jgi:hypothetical protein